MTPDRIIRATCSVWQVQEEQVLGPRKWKPVAEARRVAAYFMRVYTGLTPEGITRKLRRKPNASWASWAFWAVQDQGETDKSFANKCQEVERLLKGNRT